MPLFTATRLQITTYLLGVCPFSIAFLVFLNSSVSFVVTDLIGRKEGVGDVVGNLGFGDELVALIACPTWGLLSDRIGVRTVCVMGYAIICLALVLFVQAKNVYPQLLLARLFFSIGGAAASTMVTAVLPTMSYTDHDANCDAAPASTRQHRHAHAASIASELTITPARFRSSPTRHTNATSATIPASSENEQMASTSKVAGFVGMFTGFGALLALFLFLPLPAMFQDQGVTPGRAVQYSYYVVALVALSLSIVCFFGLNALKSERNRGWQYLLKGVSSSGTNIQIRKAVNETVDSLRQALFAGFSNADVGMGYLGGFVARASSVGISLFMPLLVNVLFSASGLCKSPSEVGALGGLSDIKRRCPQAYYTAAALTGVAETVALVAAPIFGYWSARTSRKTVPLAVASVAGIIGYPLFAIYFDPDKTKKADRAMAFIAACFIGFSQIGAIVCSLASLSTGVLSDARSIRATTRSSETLVQHSSMPDDESVEGEPLLNHKTHSRPLAEINGSVAGVYSFFGGAAILLLTKAGGARFDSVSVGVPFYMMAAFNAILLLVSVAIGLTQHQASRSN